MTRKTVMQRLRAVDRKLARVDREVIGTLVGRLYYAPIGSTSYQEVPITGFRDVGLSGSSNATGQDTAHSFAVKIDRDWWDSHRSQGTYAVVANAAVSTVKRDVAIESEVVDDGQTFADVTFVYDLEVSAFE